MPRLAPVLRAVLLPALGAAMLAAAPAPRAEAATVLTVTSSAMGRYDTSGAGFVPGFSTDSRAFVSNGAFLKNAAFFVFDLPAFVGTVTEVALQVAIARNGISVPPGVDRLGIAQVFDVTTPIPSLLTGRFAGNPTGRAIFDDLTSGVRLGGIGAPLNGAGTTITQVQDVAFQGAVENARGSRFAIGLSPFLLEPGAFIQFDRAALVLSIADPVAVPAPGSLALMGLGLLGLGIAARRRALAA